MAAVVLAQSSAMLATPRAIVNASDQCVRPWVVRCCASSHAAADHVVPAPSEAETRGNGSADGSSFSDLDGQTIAKEFQKELFKAFKSSKRATKKAVRTVAGNAATSVLNVSARANNNVEMELLKRVKEMTSEAATCLEEASLGVHRYAVQMEAAFEVSQRIHRVVIDVQNAAFDLDQKTSARQRVRDAWRELHYQWNRVGKSFCQAAR